MNVTELILWVNAEINRVVWGPPMIFMLIGTGIYFTVKTGFFQIRMFGYIFKNTAGSLFRKTGRNQKKGGISPFQAVSTALASTVGTGNIVGVATAIVAGGEGAVFWMWVSAFFGMMTKYTEVVLAVHFRQTGKDGIHYGGPMYYIEKGLHQKWLARVFAFFCIIACFGVGNIVQSNSIAAAVKNTFRVPHLLTGIVTAAVISLVIVGGIRRISGVAEKLVTFMAVFYVAGGTLALVLNASRLPGAFHMIFSNAFSFSSAGGGISGYAIARAMRFGVARGIFSNEAGLGSSPIAHAASNAESPVKQGVWGIFEVFVDTFVICTITALVIITSDLVTDPPIFDGASLTSAAFTAHLGPIGGLFITVAVVLFALTTLLGWSYYGLSCLTYLAGDKKAVKSVYKALYILGVIVGSISAVSSVWEISDTLNGLMAIPNLIALAGLGEIAVLLTKKEFRRRKSFPQISRADGYVPKSRACPGDRRPPAPPM